MSVTYEGLTFDRPGHATVRIETDDGTVVYIDPWDEVLSGSPGDGDVVFVTHDDFDHYDPEGIAAVGDRDATLAVFDAVDATDAPYAVTWLSPGSEETVDGIGVRTVPAYNRPDGAHVDDEGVPFHPEGTVTGLLLEFDGTVVYYPSDTDFLPEHESLTADVFLPPIGGHYTMDRHEAAEFARSVDPDLVLPVHYDTFEAIETDAEAFAESLEADGYRVDLF